MVGVGDGPAEGAPLNAARRALFQRALNQKDGKLVSGILEQNGQRRLVLAMKVEGTRAVVYRGAALDSARPVPSTQNSPSVACKRRCTPPDGETVEPDREDRGRPWRVAGAAQGARGRTGGCSWSPNATPGGHARQPVPWFVLAGGLVTAWLVAASSRPCSAVAPGR